SIGNLAYTSHSTHHICSAVCLLLMNTRVVLNFKLKKDMQGFGEESRYTALSASHKFWLGCALIFFQFKIYSNSPYCLLFDLWFFRSTL
uniref:Uncharacterized protein n=1 Tax=Neovison vison TaxID=452646 RepID=A0A8C7AZZ4_NEOVI